LCCGWSFNAQQPLLQDVGAAYGQSSLTPGTSDGLQPTHSKRLLRLKAQQ
jgi:hypothetical protein